MSTGSGCQVLGVGVSSREVDRLARGWIEGVALIDTVADDPGDLIAGTDEGNGISVARGDFGVDEDVLELLLAAEAERAKAVAGAAGADGKVGARLIGIEAGFECIVRP
jgi:hypothetical protein